MNLNTWKLKNTQTGQIIPIAKAAFKVGRNANADLVSETSLLSRNHATLTILIDGLYVLDHKVSIFCYFQMRFFTISLIPFWTFYYRRDKTICFRNIGWILNSEIIILMRIMCHRLRYHCFSQPELLNSVQKTCPFDFAEAITSVHFISGVYRKSNRLDQCRIFEFIT